MDNLELILFNYSKIVMPRVGGYRLSTEWSYVLESVQKSSEEKQSNFIIRLTQERKNE